MAGFRPLSVQGMEREGRKTLDDSLGLDATSSECAQEQNTLLHIDTYACPEPACAQPARVSPARALAGRRAPVHRRLHTDTQTCKGVCPH